MKTRSPSQGNRVPAQLAAPLLWMAWLCLILPLSAQTPGCLPSPAGAVGWWPLDGTFEDVVGTGTAKTAGNPIFAAGEVGPGLQFDQIDDSVHVSASPALDVGAANGLTVELWVSPADLSRQNPLVEWSDGNSVLGMHFWISVSGGAAPNGGPGSLFANLLDTTGQAHFLSTTSGLLAINQFQHVALTYNKTVGQARIYLNGQIVLDRFVGQVTPETRTAVYFGQRPMGSDRFRGIMDEIGIYNRVLTSSEIQAIYAAGPNGKCKTGQPPAIVAQPQDQTVEAGSAAHFQVVASGTAPLTYQWRFNGADLSGATAATLNLTNVQTSQAGRYSVAVANALGSATSAEAVLTVKQVYSIVVPSGFNSRAGGPGGTGLLNEVLRMHLVYGSANFPTGPIAIHEIRVRPYTGFHPFSATIAKVEIRLSTTQVQPDHLSRTFAGNFGTDTTLVYSGPLSISSAFTGPVGGPKDFDILIPLQAPFVYDPSLGSLLVELKNFTGLSTGNFVDYSSDSNDNASRMWASSSLEATVAEATDTRADILRLVYEPVRMDGPARILKQPQDQSVIAGGLAAFAVSASGAAPLSYQWRFNGADLSGATAATLNLTNVQTSQAGRYSVVVANALGSITSTSAVLTVNPAPLPPTITAQPASQTVLPGSSVTFEVSASGTAPLTYRWQFNGITLPGATNRTLTLTDVHSVNAGNYRVIVANAAGSVVSAEAALVLQSGPQPPSIIAQSGPLVASPGGRATFWVSAGGAEPLSYQWYFNGTALSGATASSLLLSDVQPSQAGTYTVAISNRYGAVTNSGILLNVVEGTGGGTVDFKNLAADMGMVYDVDGVTGLVGPAYSVQLYAGMTTEGLQPAGAPTVFLSVPGRFSGGVRVVATVPPEQTGWFQVRAWESAYGRSYEEVRAAGGKNGASVLFQVKTANPNSVPPSPPARLSGMPSFALAPGGPITPPEITTQPQNQAVPLGADASLSVAAAGTAPLRYQWYRGDVPIEWAAEASLAFTNVQPASAGDYWVVVSNAGGSVTSQVATLRVKVERILSLICPTDAAPEGSLISIPVLLTSTGEVAGLTFSLSYNPDYLALPQMAWDNALMGALTEAYMSAPGRLWGVFVFGNGTFPAGKHAVGVLSFRARTLTSAADSPLTLEIVNMADASGQPILYGSAAESGKVEMLSTGSTDNNANGVVDAGDVTLLLRLITRMETIRPWDIPRNDLNRNGVLDSGDAILLLRAAAETPEPGSGQVNPAAILAERASLTPTRSRIEVGQVITLLVRLDSLIQPVVAADLTLSYPAAAVRLSNAQALKAGPLMPSSTVLACKDDALGKLRLVLSSPGTVGGAGVPTVQPDGVLAEVTFEVLPGAASQYAWPMGLSRVEAWADGYAKRVLLGRGAVLIGRTPLAGKLAGLRQATGEFRLSLTGDAGADYVVEVSDDLASWTAWKTVTAGAGGLEILDPEAVNLPRRFYRTRAVE